MALDTELRDLLKEVNIDDGVFDALIDNVEKHLEVQFSKTRITGPQYAEVYLGAIQTAMSQAIQFALGLRTANAQAAFIEAQTLTEAQRLLTEVQNTALTTEQKNLILAQIAQVNAETALTTQKTATEVNETAKRLNEVDLVAAQEALVVQQRLTEIQTTALVTSQKTKTDEEKALLTQKILTEVQETLLVTANTAKTNSEKLRVDAETTLLGSKNNTEIATELKVDAETALLAEKQATEYAQTHDTALVGGLPVAGIVGAQTVLYERQADGFLRDAEQKLTKIITDQWSVQRSTDTGLTAPTEFADTSINAIVAKAKTGIGV